MTSIGLIERVVLLTSLMLIGGKCVLAMPGQTFSTATENLLLTTNVSGEKVHQVSSSLPATLAELQQRMAKTGSLRRAFTQYRQLRVLKQPLVSKGEMYYRKGSGICWVLSSPVPAKVLLTRDHIIIEDKQSGTQRAQTSNPVLGVFTELFFSVFSGDLGQLNEKFSVQWTLDSDHWRLKLTPVDELIRSVTSAIEVTGSDHIDTVLMQHHSGDNTLLEFHQASFDSDQDQQGCQYEQD